LTVFEVSLFLKWSGTTITFENINSLQIHSIYFSLAGFIIGLSFLVLLSIVNSQVDSKKEEKKALLKEKRLLEEDINNITNKFKIEIENLSNTVKIKHQELKNDTSYKMKIILIISEFTTIKQKNYILNELHHDLKINKIQMAEYEDKILKSFYFKMLVNGENEFTKSFRDNFQYIIDTP
jgi:hypothetical protein